VIWLGWRQQRTETMIAAALLVLVALILVPSGIEMAHQYTRDGLSHCLGFTPSQACDEAVGSLEQRFNKFIDLIGWFNLVPGLFGVALAAPFALELERGTHRLAWTQSITRRRWVVTKLGLAVSSTVLAAAVLIGILIWWRAPLVRLDGRMDTGAFDSQGTVILGYSLFALGLALAVGAVWRRAIPAVMVAFVGYFVARIFTDTWLRQRLVTPHKLTWAAGRDDPRALWHAWKISETIVSINSHSGLPPMAECIRKGATNVKQCLAVNGGHLQAVFEPASNFWPLQLVETAMFGGVAIALIAFAGWWTLHRE